MADAAASHTVCVTGASGFLGTHVMKVCLERGWTVNATVRNLEKHAPRLRSIIPGAEESGKLKIFGGCDLLVAGTFDEAITGCDTVIHTASPFFLAGADEENVVKPAVEGTRQILEAVQRLNVPQVVLTSSTAAIYAWYGRFDKDHIMTEEDWSEDATMVGVGNWYCVSKTRAEKLAWEMSNNGENFKLAVMNPSLILGPMLQPELNTSSGSLLNLINAEEGALIPNATRCLVDVRDVAEAHALALEKEEAWGKRHLLVSTSPSFSAVADILRAELPEPMAAAIPTEVNPTIPPPTLGAPAPFPTLFDTSRAQALGVEFKGTEEMVKATLASLIEHGYVTLPTEDAAAADAEAKN